MNESTPVVSSTVPSAPRDGLTAPRPVRPRRRLSRGAAIVGVLAGLITAVVVWWFAFREPEPKNDVERFQGEWSLGTPDRPDITFVRVSGDRWQYISNGEETRAFRMTLNETVSPKQIDLELIDTRACARGGEAAWGLCLRGEQDRPPPPQPGPGTAPNESR